jgi:hypothetical protein
VVSRDLVYLLKDLSDTLLQSIAHSVACRFSVIAFSPFPDPDYSRPKNRVVFLINKLHTQSDFSV